MKPMKLAGSDYDFGLTNSKSRLRAAQKFRLAALADGWAEKPGCTTEPCEIYSHLTRESGWKMHIVARTFERKSTFKYQTSVDVWAPDSLAVRAPMVYDREVLKQGTRYCHMCDSEGVETTRYAFAGRCCLKCSKTPAANGFATI